MILVTILILKLRPVRFFKKQVERSERSNKKVKHTQSEETILPSHSVFLPI